MADSEHGTPPLPVQSQLRELQRRLEEQDALIGSLRRTLAKVVEDNNDLKEYNSTLKKTQTSMIERIAHQQAAVERLTSEKAELASDNARLFVHAREAEAAARGARAEADALRSEVDAIQQAEAVITGALLRGSSASADDIDVDDDGSAPSDGERAGGDGEPASSGISSSAASADDVTFLRQRLRTAQRQQLLVRQLCYRLARALQASGVRVADVLDESLALAPPSAGDVDAAELLADVRREAARTPPVPSSSSSSSSASSTTVLAPPSPSSFDALPTSPAHGESGSADSLRRFRDALDQGRYRVSRPATAHSSASTAAPTASTAAPVRPSESKESEDAGHGRSLLADLEATAVSSAAVGDSTSEASSSTPSSPSSSSTPSSSSSSSTSSSSTPSSSSSAPVTPATAPAPTVAPSEALREPSTAPSGGVFRFLLAPPMLVARVLTSATDAVFGWADDAAPLSPAAEPARRVVSL